MQINCTAGSKISVSNGNNLATFIDPREKNAMKNKTGIITKIFFATVITFLPWRLALADSTWTVYNQMNSPLPTDYVASIDFDSEGNQYIGTSGGGVVLIRDSIWTIWNESSSGVPINAVRRAAFDGSGDLWLAAASGNLDSSPVGFGLARLDFVDSTWSMINHGLEVNQIVTGIIFDGQTRYVSTYGGGITIYDDIGWIRYRFNSRTEFTYEDGQQQAFEVPGGTYIPSDYIRAIDFDYGGGILWMATANGGAVSYDGVEWITFNTSNSGLPSNQLLSIKVNPDNGIIAFGTTGFGVALLDDPDWTVYNSSNSPMTNGFVSTLEYRPVDRELWIGTGYGVWVLQTDDQWRGYIPPDNNFIWGEFYSDIAFDSLGSVWVSAYRGGVASLALDSIPDPPPTDSLYIDVDRMFIYFYNRKPQERIFTELYVDGVPELAAEDTMFFKLESDFGELYSFGLTFGDFGMGETTLDRWDIYRYKYDRLMISIRINQDDQSRAEISIKDFDANMNRENYSNTMEVTMGLGDNIGNVTIYLAPGNQWDVPEDDPDGSWEAGQVQVFELIDFVSEAADDRSTPATSLNTGNYPNPFNGRTIINFNLVRDASVVVAVYDMLGRLVNTAHSGFLSAGQHDFAWPVNGSVKSGIYIYTVTIDGQSVSKKMTYLK